jgi:hypothetical protein
MSRLGAGASGVRAVKTFSLVVTNLIFVLSGKRQLPCKSATAFMEFSGYGIDLSSLVSGRISASKKYGLIALSVLHHKSCRGEKKISRMLIILSGKKLQDY